MAAFRDAGSGTRLLRLVRAVLGPKGYKDTYDWSHANGLTYDPKDDAILVSVCHQDAGLTRLAPLK